MASTMSTFILAMLLHPHVYRKAQEEIDRVIGPSRLPDYEDSPSLPYLNAVIKETYRYAGGHVGLRPLLMLHIVGGMRRCP